VAPGGQAGGVGENPKFFCLYEGGPPRAGPSRGGQVGQLMCGVHVQLHGQLESCPMSEAKQSWSERSRLIWSGCSRDQ